MAFSGYLIAFRNNSNQVVQFPLEYMRYDTFEVGENIQDLDSSVDTAGYLHRNILAHRRAKVTFKTPSMNKTKMSAMLKYFTDAFGWNGGNAAGRECFLYYYDSWTDQYKSGTFYMPSTLPFSIRSVDTTNNDINYNEMTISFIQK